jgi:elongation factor Ts
MDQKFIKDEDKTVQALLTELVAKLGERVVIKRFRRFEIGSE